MHSTSSSRNTSTLGTRSTTSLSCLAGVIQLYIDSSTRPVVAGGTTTGPVQLLSAAAAAGHRTAVAGYNLPDPGRTFFVGVGGIPRMRTLGCAS
eukprot:941893-Rhodomonas_salina.3